MSISLDSIMVKDACSVIECFVILHMLILLTKADLLLQSIPVNAELTFCGLSSTHLLRRNRTLLRIRQLLKNLLILKKFPFKDRIGLAPKYTFKIEFKEPPPRFYKKLFRIPISQEYAVRH